MGSGANQNRFAIHPDGARSQVLNLRTEGHWFKFDPLAFQRCPCSRLRSHTTSPTTEGQGRQLPVKAAILKQQFGSEGDFPGLRLRGSLTGVDRGERLAEKHGPADGEALKEVPRGVVRPNSFSEGAEYWAGIEAFFELERHGSGDFVPSDD